MENAVWRVDLANYIDCLIGLQFARYCMWPDGNEILIFLI